MPVESKNGVLVASGDDIPKVASALGSKVRLRILGIISASGKADIDTIAREVGKSKANVSTQVKILERAGLVRVTYAPGRRGVKKYCLSDVKEVRLVILEEGGREEETEGEVEEARPVAPVVQGGSAN